MQTSIFNDRIDAARQLAEKLRELKLHNPLILGIPRGGVVIAAELARLLDADMDVTLSRKLRHPHQPELAVGAVSEDGQVYIRERFRKSGLDEQYLKQERAQRMAEIEERRRMFREVRPPASIAGRSVILTDDGIATGATMFAALQIVKTKKPRETILAVPVAPPGQFKQFVDQCDHAVAIVLPEDFLAIGQFYEDFQQIDDQQVRKLLSQFAPSGTEP